MSKELIVRLREAAFMRCAGTAMIGAEDLSAAADALEQIDAAYTSAVEAGKSLAQQALKAEQERDCAVRALTRAGHMLAEGAAECKPPVGPAATPLLDKIDKISAERDALTAELKALREQEPSCWTTYPPSGRYSKCKAEVDLWERNNWTIVPLYAHPVPARKLTDAVDDLARHIRQIDGNHSMDAGALAEGITEWADRYLKGEGK